MYSLFKYIQFFHNSFSIILCRTYRYNAVNIEEDLTRRWRYLTKKHNYEMINQEPRIGLNGMWKQEVRDIEQFAKALDASTGKNTYA